MESTSRPSPDVDERQAFIKGFLAYMEREAGWTLGPPGGSVIPPAPREIDAYIRRYCERDFGYV
jgi:hypothetical protein